MSIFDEVLIIIDDLTEVKSIRLEELLPQYTRQLIGSTLGRLIGRGWIQQVKDGSEPVYRITESGNTYISSTLAAIRRNEERWSGTWFCVAALLPSTKRRERDMLRRFLSTRGFGALIDGLWITPWNRLQDVSESIAKIGIGSWIVTFETQSLGQATTQVIVQTAWDWKEVHERFEELAAEARQHAEKITQLAATTQDVTTKTKLRILAKSFVFNYGVILSQDPNLPKDIQPENTARTEMYALYSKIRTYCY